MRLILYIILFFPLLLSGQDRTIDSLKLALKNAKHDTTRIVIFSKLIEQSEVDDILLFAESSTKLCKQNLEATNVTNKGFYLKYLANSLYATGFFYFNQSEYPKALEYYRKSLKIQEEINDKMGIAITLNDIGAAMERQGDIPKALEYYHKSLKIDEELKNKYGIAYTLNNIGSIFDNQGDIPKALEYFHKSLKIQEEMMDKMGIATCLNNIGFIYYNQDDFIKALEYYQRSLKIYEEINDKNGIAYSLNNIGLNYRKQGNDMKALEYYQKSLKIREEINDKNGIAMSKINIGVIYDRKGDTHKALEYYHNSLKLYEEITNKKGIALSLNNIANSMVNAGQLNEGLSIATRSLRLAKELGYPEHIKNAATTLKSIYTKQLNYKEALSMYELEIQMRDSINNVQTKKASVKKQFQYEYEKKATADSVKHAEEQKVKNALLTAQQAQLKQEKTQRLALYGGLALVIAFSIFVFNRFRVTIKQKLVIEQQKLIVDEAYQQLEEKNKEVLDSIHYAKRIQTALLTSEKYIERKLNELHK